MKLPQLQRNSANLESTAVAHKPVQKQQQFFKWFFAWLGTTSIILFISVVSYRSLTKQIAASDSAIYSYLLR
jgi:hypothetical protein